MGAASKSVSVQWTGPRSEGWQNWMLAVGTGVVVSVDDGVLGAGRTGKIRAVEGLVFDLGGSRSARADSSHALGLKSSPARRSQNQLDGAVLELGEGWGEQR